LLTVEAQQCGKGKEGKGLAEMKNQVVDFTDNTVTLRVDSPRNIGSKIDLEVRLPQGILIKSFLLNGTITSCECEGKESAGAYLLKMKIGDLSPLNHKILEAYKDFLAREEMLRDIKIDLQAFQQAFETFGQKLRLLRQTAEEVRNNVKGTLELIKRNAQGKNTTIH
jgi:hypothetical protein